jgi:hypothetical protein
MVAAKHRGFLFGIAAELADATSSEESQTSGGINLGCKS